MCHLLLNNFSGTTTFPVATSLAMAALELFRSLKTVGTITSCLPQCQPSKTC